MLLGVISAIALLLGVAWTSGVPAAAAVATKAPRFVPASQGELDCNGFSKVQKSLKAMYCADIRGAKKNTRWIDDGRFYDNGHYIGHDEPDTTFTSSAPGSGNNVNWTITLGRDPKAAPTATNPGHDVSHWFELGAVPWFSMALCDPNSFPLTACTPQSDANRPICFNANCSSGLGGGSALMEMQLYAPGVPPFPDSISCDNTHWCAALTIDSLACTPNFASCNPNCTEPINFAFIQKNGVPAGPPSPQDTDTSTLTPNKQTLLMNPGDKVTFHMWDAPAPGGGNAFEVAMKDLTTHQTGFMQASAVNGFMTTSSADCSGTPFNFEPEYNTAKPGNINPWGAIQTDISTEFETGHWEACTSLSNPLPGNPFDPNDTGPVFSQCNGPYENTTTADGDTPEVADLPCYPAGDTHPGFDGVGTSSAPDVMTGCQTGISGDTDFDGSSYWKEWPTSLKPGTFPGSFLELFPTTDGAQYPGYYIQTDLALSEQACGGNTLTTAPPGTQSLAGCTVPPPGPGHFYPYWSFAKSGGSCTIMFGNVSGTGLATFGKDAQYGTNQFNNLGYPEFIGPNHPNPCG